MLIYLFRKITFFLLLVGLVFSLSIEQKAFSQTPTWGTFTEYQGAKKLCYQHVKHNPIFKEGVPDRDKIVFYTKNSFEEVATFYKVQGMLQESLYDFRPKDRENEHLRILPVEKAKNIPCQKNWPVFAKTLIMITIDGPIPQK